MIRPLLPSLPHRCRTSLLGLLLVLLALLGTGGPAAAEATAWAALTPAQRQALAPLQRDWSSLDASRQSKWLEVAARFPRMSADEQRRLQERMTQWTRLTPAERERARLQFQETRQLPADEKRARWEAYQALTEEQRYALAQRAEKPAKGGARTDNGARRANPANGTAKNNLVEARPAPPARSVAPSVVTTRPGATTTTIYPFRVVGVGSGPWDWWNKPLLDVIISQYPAQFMLNSETLHMNGLLTNPDMSAAKGRLYVDTIMQYFIPRACQGLQLESCLLVSKTEEVANEDLVQLSVAPKPSSSDMLIQGNAQTPMMDLQVFNVNGMLVRSVRNLNNNQYTLQRDNLPPGKYLVKVRFEQGFLAKRVIFN